METMEDQLKHSYQGSGNHSSTMTFPRLLDYFCARFRHISGVDPGYSTGRDTKPRESGLCFALNVLSTRNSRKNMGPDLDLTIMMS